MLKKIKVCCVNGYTNYANWFPHEIVESLEEAELVLAEGGSDVSSKYYEEESGRFSHHNEVRDAHEYAVLTKAIELSKPIFGTCKGAQWLSVLAGGKLVQHLNHPSSHSITFYDGSSIKVNSLHHQLMHPYNLNKGDYEIVAWASGLSNMHLNGKDEQMMLPRDRNDINKEVEIAYFRKLNGLGFQNHLELMNYDSKACQIGRMYLNHLVEDTLDMVLTLSIPVSRLLDDNFVFEDDEIELYNRIKNRRENKYATAE